MNIERNYPFVIFHVCLGILYLDNSVIPMKSRNESRNVNYVQVDRLAVFMVLIMNG